MFPHLYLQKVEEILAWCNTNNIEVKTYNEWANILYNQTPDPYENVFPPLNVNLDTYAPAPYNTGGIPDGYEQRYGNDQGNGRPITGAPSPEITVIIKTMINGGLRIFMLQNLGGVEKGENEFEIWTKGGQDDRIEVIFSFPNTTNPNQVFIIPANTSTWQKYNLSNSTNTNTILNIPLDASLIKVEVNAQYFTGPIKVSGMALYKKKPIISANLKVNLEGVFSGGIMSTSTSFQNVVPTGQPFNIAPWTYTGTETFTTLPANAIDWVLVELRSGSAANTMVKRKAGLVKNDGTIINADDGLPISFEIAEGITMLLFTTEIIYQ
ncbi:MAG: hypothetical protein H6613_03740 [Ignavibacteriales bacterium]|nr:hypothetical protein [Ignavibacteriales bacterium]